MTNKGGEMIKLEEEKRDIELDMLDAKIELAWLKYELAEPLIKEE